MICVGDCGDYDYDYHYHIKYTGRLQQQPTNPGHLQTDITLCSPVRARISATVRVMWFCAGTGLAAVSSATGPAECLINNSARFNSEFVKGRESN